MDSYLQGFLASAVSLIIGGGIVLLVTWLRKDGRVYKLYDEYDYVINVVINVIIGIAKNTAIITPDEWAEYEKVAADRGLDPRLVAAVFEASSALDTLGIKFPLRYLFHLIEGEYQKLKERGFFDEDVPV